MTTTNKDKIRYKINLQPHLKELNCFTINQMSEPDLIPLEQTKAILKQGEKFRQLAPFKFTLAFHEKDSDRFKRYIARLQEANSSKIYIWINRTNECGTSKLKSLFDINWDFEFTCSAQGLFVLETTDMQDRILFDFFEEDGQQWLEVETSGPNWSKVRW